MRRKLVRRIFPKGNRRALRRLFLWISLLLFSFAARSAAEAAEIHSAPINSVGPGPQFAIADFDGDLRPDLASIEAGPSSSATTTYYWIQLQLSVFGWQSIKVVAPAGGLLIEPRDVDNGNHFIDLVLVTAWSRQPVAILINDGHGGFSKVEPTAFPEVFTDSTATTNWVSTSRGATADVGAPPQPRPKMRRGAKGLADVHWQVDSISPSIPGFFFVCFLISSAGRAPPSEVPHS
jgi:hypothetical protein